MAKKDEKKSKQTTKKVTIGNKEYNAAYDGNKLVSLGGSNDDKLNKREAARSTNYKKSQQTTKKVTVGNKKYNATYDGNNLVGLDEVDGKINKREAARSKNYLANQRDSRVKDKKDKYGGNYLERYSDGDRAFEFDVLQGKDRYNAERDLFHLVNSGEASDADKLFSWAYKKDREDSLPLDIGDNYQALMKGVSGLSSSKNKQKDYDDTKLRSQKLREDLQKYIRYYDIYGDTDGGQSVIKSMYDSVSGIIRSLNSYADSDEYWAVQTIANADSYDDIVRARGMLKRKKGSEGYDDESVNRKLNALDRMSTTQQVYDLMSEDDWNTEIARINSQLKTAQDKRDSVKKSYATGPNGWMPPSNKKEYEESGVERDVLYYSTLLDNAKEGKRLNRINYDLAKKWGENKNKSQFGSVVPAAQGTNDYVYDAVNYRAIPEANPYVSPAGPVNLNSGQMRYAETLTYMNDDERNMYNYLYKYVSPDKASEYLDDLTPLLNKRQSLANSRESRLFAMSHPVLSTVGNVLSSPLRNLASLGLNAKNMITGASDDEIDQYAPEYGLHRWSDDVYGGVLDTIDSTAGKIAYSAGTQISELVVNMAVSAGIGSAIGGMASASNAATVASKSANIINQLLLSSDAMLNTTLSYKEQGESDLAAVGMGLLSGAIEAWTERHSMSNLLKTPDIYQEASKMAKVGLWAKKIGGDFVGEGIEEVEANAYNTIAAAIFNLRDNDTFLATIDKARLDGKTDSEALVEAIRAVAPEYIESFVVGGIAGGAFGGVNAISGVEAYNDEREIAAKIFSDEGTSREVVEKYLIAMGYRDEATIANAANAIVRKGRGLSVSESAESMFEEDARLRGMLHGYVDVMDAADVKQMTNDTLDEMNREDGASHVEATPQSTIRSMIVEENITNKNADAIIENEELRAAFVEAAGIELSGTKAEMRKTIRESAGKVAQAIDENTAKTSVAETAPENKPTHQPRNVKTSPAPVNEFEMSEEDRQKRRQRYELISDDSAENSYMSRGRNGAKAYTYALNKGGLVDELIEEGYSEAEARSKTEQLFRFMYNQGRTEGNMELAVRTASENILTGHEDVAREFFASGQADAQGRLIGSTKAQLVQNQTLKDMKANGQINSRTVRAINALASKLGINIQFNDTLKEGELGRFNKKTGTLMINAKAKNKYFVTAVHESIHAIRSIDPESYNRLTEMVTEIFDSNKAVASKAQNLIYKRYKKEVTKDGKVDLDLVNEEFVAKVVSHLLTDESFIKELSQTDRGTVQRVFDAIVDFFEKIFKRYEENSTPNETEFQDALKELQSDFNSIKAIFENALNETSKVRQSEMVLPKSINGVVELNNKVVAIENNGDLLFNKEQWDSRGRAVLENYLNSQVETGEIDEAYAKQIMEFMDVMAKASDEMGAEYLHYNNWANYKIEKNENGAELTCVVKNGDYALNIDFSTKCVKRETLDAVINVLAKKGVLNKIKADTTAIAVINQIIKKSKLDIACNLCFVDAKRSNVIKWAKSFSDMWNYVVDLVVPKGEVVSDFGFSGAEVSTVSTLTTPVFDGIESKIPKKYRTGKGEIKPIVLRMIKALKNDENLIKHISVNDIASSFGLDMIKRSNKVLYDIVNSHQGSAKPKLTHGNVPYNNEVINKKFDTKTAYMVGGFRLQSFSDYISSLFFDYMQTFAEFAAKKMPVHAYTKVLEFVKIFGLSGAKINMSGVPMVKVGAEQAEQLSKLYVNGKKTSRFYNSSLVKRLKANAGLDENGNFLWAPESIDIEEAKKIASDPEYGKNCGIIAVGVSDKHIWKLLETPWISQVIPYHRSGINTATARMYNVDLFNDYTNKQTTKVKVNGKYVSINNKNVKVKDFDFYGNLIKLGNVEDAHIQIANMYIDWCEENGHLPKFADFAYKMVDGKKVRNENYYKLLADFRMTDVNGKYSPQTAVTMNFPETNKLLGYISEGLSKEETRKTAIDNKVDSIVAEVREALDIEDDVLYSKEDDVSNVPDEIPYINQGTKASSDAAYFELQKEVKKKLDEHVKKYGAMPKGEEAVRDAVFPERTSDDKYVRRFARTAFEAETISDEVATSIAEDVANGELWTTYSRISDKASTQVALNRLKSVGFDQMLEEWESKLQSNERIEKGDIAKAMVLAQQASKKGDTKTAMALVAEIAAEGTRAGQLVQSLRLLKKLGAEANVYYIEKTIKNLQKDIDEKYKGRFSKKKHVTIEVPEDLIKKYRDVFRREQKSKSGDHSESDKIIDEIMQKVADQVPVTWVDKLNAWRYLSMLGNARTHIRNMLGSLVFMPAIFAKNMTSSVIEGTSAAAVKLFAKKDMARTKSIGGVLTFGGLYMQYAKKDAKKIESVLRGESKYNELQKALQNRKIFTSRFMAWANKAIELNSKALEWEDWIFLKHNYARALTMYMKANKLDPQTMTEKQLEKARTYAINEAQKATFRDESAFAKAIARFEKTNAATKLLVGGLMPFKTTPVNVLKRGIEYSPAGILPTIGKGIKGVAEGEFSAAQFIDGLGATLSGSALCAVGIYLASQGLLHGSGDDEEENRLDTLNGIQNYSLKLWNGTYTIDWMSPAAMSLFVGYEIWNAIDDGETSYADVVDSLSKITEPVFEMSMLEGVMGVLQAAAYAPTNAELASEALLSVLSSFGGQFVPTLLGQVARTVDPVRRRTYIDKNKNVPEWLQSFVQAQMKKIPGLSQKLEPYVNAKGEEELNAEGNIVTRALQNFLSPGYYKRIRSSEADEELSRLYSVVGEDAKDILPKTVTKKINVNGKTVNLSDEQYTTYQRVTGQTYYAKLKEVISSDYYKSLPDEDKARFLGKVRDYAEEQGRKAAVKNYRSKDGWLEVAMSTSDGYKYILNAESEDKFSKEDLSEDDYINYEEQRNTLFDDVLSAYDPEGLGYDLADKYYDDLYAFAHKISLEDNSNGEYTVDDTWINTIRDFSPEEVAQYIYGRAIASQYDDQDKANEALQNDTFISDNVRGYLLKQSFGGNKSPSTLYTKHLANVRGEVSMEMWTGIWEKWDKAEKYKVGKKTIDKKDQILPEIDKLSISDYAKSRMYDAFGWGDSEKALKGVPWNYVPSQNLSTELDKKLGQDISAKSTYNNNAAYGQCVWYARGRADEKLGKYLPSMGNANEMYQNAKKNSQVEASPDNLRGDMLVTYRTGSSSLGLKYGHVIYIEAVDGDDVYYTEGGNYKMAGTLRKATRQQIMDGKTNDRNLGKNVIGFIDVTKY